MRKVGASAWAGDVFRRGGASTRFIVMSGNDSWGEGCSDDRGRGMMSEIKPVVHCVASPQSPQRYQFVDNQFSEYI